MFAILFIWKIINHFIILIIYVICFIIQIFVDFEAKHRLVIKKKAVDKNNKSYKYHISPNNDNEINDDDGNDVEFTSDRRGMTPSECESLTFIGTF